MVIEVAPILTAVAVFLSAGVALLAAFSLLPWTAAHARPLWPTLATELVIVGAVALAFWLGGPALFAALLLMAFRVGYETGAVALARLPAGGSSGRWPPYAIGAGSAALALVAAMLPFAAVVAGALAAMAVIAGFLALRREHTQSLPNALAEIAVFPLLPLSMFVAAAMRPDLAGLLLVLFLLVETYDSYALLGGKLFGRRLAFPRLSPKKTVEGLAAGGIGLAVTAALLGVWLLDLSPLVCIVAAVAIGILSTAGDLAASRLKRIAGVKDYPFFMPRQGGLFDIVDAWLFSGAAMAAFLLLAGTA